MEMHAVHDLIIGHFENPAPHQKLLSGDVLIGSGWVVAQTQIRRLSIFLNDMFLTEAEHGLPRADIAERFPDWPDSAKAGFSFSATFPNHVGFGDDCFLALHIETSTERAIVTEMPVTLCSSSSETIVAGERSDGQTTSDDLTISNSATSQKSTHGIQFGIDRPTLNGDRAREPVLGLLIVSGWALAASGIGRVEVQVDNDRAVMARYGGRRMDIATKMPGRGGALLSGFSATFPRRLRGNHWVTVRVHSRAGETAWQRFHVFCESLENATSELRPQQHVPDGALLLTLLALERMQFRPRFAIVVLESQTANATQMELTLASIRRQAYAHWHVYPSGLDPTRPETETTETQGSVPWLSADFVVVLRTGDRLSADALLRFAEAAALHPGADFVYADEVRWDAALGEHHPCFKPDWAPDLLLSTNYLGRAWCATVQLARKVGLSATLVGASDYERVLRLTSAAQSIHHVQALLLEQVRNGRESPSIERRALQHEAWRQSIEGQVLVATNAMGEVGGTYRLKRRISDTAMVSIIMPTCGAAARVETAITSLRAITNYRHYEIICVDNLDPRQQQRKSWLRAQTDRVIETVEPFNWSRYNNLAAQYASGDYFLFLNDDVEVFEPDWLRALLEHGARPEVGAVGGLLLYPDGTIQHAGMFLDGAVGRHAYRGAPAEEPGTFGLALTQRNVIAVTGACMLMRRAVFTQMGGFDEAHSVVNNDLDFCLRLHRAGLRVIYTPYARLIHHELSSRADMPDVFDATRFGDDWRALFLRGDPYFHPALSTRDDGYNEETEPFEALMGVKPVLAHEHVRDIWLLGPDAAEDAALMFPALRRLRQYFPAARIHLLADAATLGLMAAEPVVDTFDVLAPPAEPDTDVGAASLAPYPADIALDLRLKPEGRAILKQTGAKLLAGFDSNGLFPWLQVPVAWEGRTRGRAPRQTLTDLALHLVEAVAAACPKPATLPARVPDASALAQWIEPSTARTFLERSIICIDPSPRAGLWQWPSERFAALIEMLCTSEDMNAVIIGAVEDTPLIDAIMAKLATPARVISLAGRVAPLELPAVLGACTLYVGNDSGRQHLAAAQPIPTVCISASHVDAVERAASGAHVVIVRRHVVCGPCYLAHPDHCDRDVYCLRSISPGDVFRACHRLLRLVYAEPEHEQERL